MTNNNRVYELLQSDRALLAACEKRAQLRILTAGSFRMTSRGMLGMGLLATVGEGPDAIVVENLPVPDANLRTFPGVSLQAASMYAGDWKDDLINVQPLSECVNRPECIVTNVQVIRDQVVWRDQVSKHQVSITTDIGLLFDLQNGCRLFLLSRDSEAGIMELALLESQDQVDWWMSEAGVRYTWAFDESAEGQRVHVARRTSYRA